MHVCTCGGNYFPRWASQNGCVVQLTTMFVIDNYVCDLLASEENCDVLDLVLYLYVGMD